MHGDALATPRAVPADRVACQHGSWLRWVDDLENHPLTGRTSGAVASGLFREETGRAR